MGNKRRDCNIRVSEAKALVLRLLMSLPAWGLLEGTLMRATGRKLKIDAHEYKPNPYTPRTLKTRNSHQTAML